LANHRFASAASHFRYALQWDSKGVEAHVGLGNVYLKTGKKEKALQEFAAALAVSRHSSAAERGIHDARSEGEEQAAFQDLEDAVNRDPHNADLVTTYAEELIERQRLDEAAKEANLALSIDPQQWHAYCALGRIAALTGNFQEASKNLKIAIAHDGDDDDAILALGDLNMKQGNPGEAVKLFGRLIKVVPDESEGYFRLADALDATGDKTASDAMQAKGNDIKKRAQGSAN
jgi:tetratricopeptide (TPR) repeat protein